MRTSSILEFCSSLALLMAAAAPAFGAGFDDLLTHVPPHANTLVMVDAARMYDAPVAKRETWRKEHESGHMAGGMLLPEGTQRLILAAALDFEYLNPEWEAALVEMTKAPTPAVIAQRDGGTVDMVGKMPTVLLPEDATLIDFTHQVVGIMSPANRQRAAEWVNYRGSGLGFSLSPYLDRAVSFTQKTKAPIVLAFDLRQLLSPAFVRNQLNEAASVQGKGLDLDKLSELLAGLQGITIEIFVDETRHGRMQFDFGDDASLLGDVARPLVLETLAGAGAMIDDFNSWKASVDGHVVSFEGPLSDGGMARLLSLVDLPTHWLVDAQQPPPGADDQGDATAYNSLSYFRTVSRLIDDINLQKRSAKTLGEVALWYDLYARRIDRLPSVGVDPDLLDYGSGTAEMLRQAGQAMRGIGIQSHAKEMAIYPRLSGVYTRSRRPGYGSSYHRGRHSSRYGRYGRRGYNRSSLYFQFQNVSGERRKAQAAEVAKGATTENQIMVEVANATTKIRQEMTKKYKIDF